MSAPVIVPADPLTFAQLYALAQQAALLRTTLITPASFSPGFMVDMHVGAASLLAQQNEESSFNRHLKTFIRTAQGSDLDTLALDHFNLPRPAAYAAVGAVVFSRASITAGNVFIVAGTLVGTPAGQIFQTTMDAILTGLSATVNIQALLIGASGNVNANTITVLNTILTDSTVTVNNPQQTSGGLDALTDAQFRQYIINWWQTLRRGTPAAIVFGASQVAGVVSAFLDETTSPPTLYIADITGTANTTLIALVQAALINYRAAGVPINVASAVVVLQSIQLHLTFFAAFGTQATQAAAVGAVLALVQGLAVGQTLFESAIIAAATVAGIKNVQVIVPAGDVVALPNQIIFTQQSLITLV